MKLAIAICDPLRKNQYL